jgi:hypothetical protein
MHKNINTLLHTCLGGIFHPNTSSIKLADESNHSVIKIKLNFRKLFNDF